MPKAFLSHSSKQKLFVESLAIQLNSFSIIDSKSFEIGMLNSEEILNLIDKCDLFVVCLSNEALDSKWVNDELRIAYENLNRSKLTRIFPIIIDEFLDHSDIRIPEWLKEYNLQKVLRVPKAVRLIKSRLREISWDKHPKLKERELLFSGRNDELKKIEERIDNIEKSTPTVLMASGLNKVGRKKFLKEALLKTNTTFRESTEYSTIYLDTRESIEDFILKIYDLGYTKDLVFPNFLETTIDEKIELAISLIKDIKVSKEIVFIDDSGSIVLPDGTITIWFWNILAEMQKRGIKNEVLFCIATRFRPLTRELVNYDDVYQINISSLNLKEKTGLMKRLLKIHNITLTPDEITEVVSLFNGYPEQVFHAIDILEKEPVKYILENPNLIKDYNKEIFNKLIKEIEDKPIYRSVLSLLVEFDFISIELLYEILDEYNQRDLDDVVHELDLCSMVDYLGSRKEYFKLNDGIKEYLLRSGYKISIEKKAILKKHIENFIKRDDLVNEDISDFFYSVKGALQYDYNIQNKLLIPSHYLKTMIYLYEREQQYPDVVVLADKILENFTKIDVAILKEIKYWLCLSLARLRDERFKEEVQFFNQNSDYHFLFGFFYRLTGKYEFALENFQEALSKKPRFPRAQRELVQVLIGLEQYQDAFEHARFNYENDNYNPFHIQAYFDCLVRNENAKEYISIIDQLLQQLSTIGTEKAKEMYSIAVADYELFINKNGARALELINTSLMNYNSLYLISRKFTIAEKSDNLQEMESSLRQYREFKRDLNPNEKNQYFIMQAKLKAHMGDINGAANIINSNLSFFPEHAKTKYLDYIKSMKQ